MSSSMIQLLIPAKWLGLTVDAVCVLSGLLEDFYAVILTMLETCEVFSRTSGILYCQYLLPGFFKIYIHRRFPAIIGVVLDIIQ